MNEQPGLNYSPPTFESNQPVISQSENRPEGLPNPELVPPAIINSMAGSGSLTSLSVMPTFQASQVPPTGGVMSSSAARSHTQPQTNQHLETQYVNQAKKIIASTTGDPYLRTKELNRIKAEFLDRKYSKKIKLSGE